MQHGLGDPWFSESWESGSRGRDKDRSRSFADLHLRHQSLHVRVESHEQLAQHLRCRVHTLGGHGWEHKSERTQNNNNVVPGSSLEQRPATTAPLPCNCVLSFGLGLEPAQRTKLLSNLKRSQRNISGTFQLHYTYDWKPTNN